MSQHTRAPHPTPFLQSVNNQIYKSVQLCKQPDPSDPLLSYLVHFPADHSPCFQTQPLIPSEAIYNTRCYRLCEVTCFLCSGPPRDLGLWGGAKSMCGVLLLGAKSLIGVLLEGSVRVLTSDWLIYQTLQPQEKLLDLIKALRLKSLFCLLSVL